MGFGSLTGIDVGPEEEGLMPTPAWRRRHFKTEIDKIWTSGDSVQLAIGQGDLLTTPLQMTRFYALLANGGKLVEPHLVQRIEEPKSDEQAPVIVRPIRPRPPRDLNLDPNAIQIVQEGLFDATHGANGTSQKHLRDVRRRHRGQDGDGGEVQETARLRERRRAAARPVLVVRLWAHRKADDRRLRPDREWRPRRHRGRSRRHEAAREVLRCPRDAGGSGELGLGMATRVIQGHARSQAPGEVASFIRHLDYLLFAAVGGLVAYGLWVLSAVTRNDIAGNPDYYVVRQGINVGLGVVALVALTAVNPEVYRRIRRPLYGLLIALLAIVFVADAVRGSQRWIDIGFFRFQPSELGKLILIVCIAGFLADRSRRLDEWRTVLSAVGLGILAAFLVFIEPDFGTALMYVGALAAALFIAGVPWSRLAALGLSAGTAAITLLWVFPSAGIDILKPYQVQRLTGFLNPDLDPSGTTYNATQSITAVGSGGLNGRASRAPRRPT